ncbi:MAG: hypothetical protein KBB61_04905 [Paludibacteraceae bacterium]|jgi:preprotein translocase subunit SecG|nr:hypothetical protein [Paludibacteraceae bacterium]MBP9039699.1 hypothetical protein [Paludibacteraceae bacterium]HOG37095.1 hypothetical protein [Paludibacteraceae bacterium]HPO47826.1 hypothetical protein [Paludibacteraceae bacterium]
MKNSKIANRLILFAVIFFLILMVTVFIHKIHGNSGRPGSPDYSSAIPWTWVEIENALPLFIGGSLFFTTLLYVVVISSKKKQEQDIEAARKRIAAREKDGKDSKNLVDEIVKDVMQNSKQAKSKDEKE